jgi:hypothetical protein
MKKQILLVIGVLLAVGPAALVSSAAGPQADVVTYLEGPCSVSWTCPAGSCDAVVSCTGAETCSAAADYVSCDGNRTDCVMPELSCLIACMDDYMVCDMRCIPMPDPPPDPCGCMAELEACRAGCCY